MSKIRSAFETLSRRGLLALIEAVFYEIYIILIKVCGKQTITKKIYNQRMILDVYDLGISRTLILYGQRELEHKKLLEEILEPGMVVLDIGANIGYYALIELELIGKQGHLIAVEPSPANFNYLKQNLKLNKHDNVDFHQVAVSLKSGSRDFYLSEMSNLNTFHFDRNSRDDGRGSLIKVETVSFKEIARDRNIDLIRMDVEGHEVEILQSVVEYIKSGGTPPAIIFETHFDQYQNKRNFDAVLSELFLIGYSASKVGSSWEKGTDIIAAAGYSPYAFVKSDGYTRALFENIAPNDAINLITKTGGVRTVLLTKIC